MGIFIKTEEKAVFDFELVYDTDSKIHVDWYANGLLWEQKILGGPTAFYKKNYGIIVADLKEYEEYQKFFYEKLSNKTFLQEIVPKLAISIIDVHRACRKFELERTRENAEILHRKVSYMLGFKRVSDYCQNNIDLNKENVPSYLLRIVQGLQRLKEHPSIENKKIFIKRYGYLHTFKIARNELETLEGVQKKINKMFPDTVIRKRKNWGLGSPSSIGKYILWYEELRHVYQLRALRNFRNYFEEININIHDGLFEGDGI
ncbi:hypothetical protein [Peribacillus deserti]|uniref:Uncharacterized protein n=1 Tax=Peribacillus deserti TaxID=673318 RepID=A0A2N5MBM6_9BACI|nr:hypothetical protein [Peribacillus deserti]PLT31769.1 hypothetical protein CUU66_00995 [Peribacillus deserti]